jgi:predicted amidohydrolase YtcJ
MKPQPPGRNVSMQPQKALHRVWIKMNSLGLFWQHCSIPATIALVATTVSLAGATEPPPEGGNLLIVNGSVFGRTHADALYIKGGRIQAVGKRSTVEPLVPSGVPIVDAAGGAVLPGFHDAHIHMLSGGLSLLGLNLNELRSVDAVVEAVDTFAQSHPSDKWILGRGWMYDIVPKGGFPTRREIDRVVPDRPVLLDSYDGHSSWVNSRALALAHIDSTSIDPAGGRIVREADGKTPSGVLLERAAHLVRNLAPEPDRATRLEALRRAAQHCLELGITCVDDIEDTSEIFALYGELLNADKLPIRVTVSLPVNGNLNGYDSVRQRYNSPFLRFGFLKGFIDGVIESRTAYMLAPYEGTQERGTALLRPDRLRELIVGANAHGFTAGFHSIGDGAVRMALDGLESLSSRTRETHFCGRIEHIEVLDPADAPRFQKLGIVASMQPLHAMPSGDTPDDDVWSKNLGASRLRHSFPWRELLDAGATLAFGSDWPVMSADPLQGIAVATTRQDEAGRPAAGWNAHQRISTHEAVAAYTEGSAIAVGRGTEMGKLAPGYSGDIVILDPAVNLEQPATLWHGTRVRFVVVGGVIRFPSPQPQPDVTGSKISRPR